MRISATGIAAALAVCAMLIMPAATGASTTSYWTQAGMSRFYNGKFFGTALTQDGRVTLGLAMNEAFKSTEPYLWTLAYDSRGTLWAGSGNKAILYKIGKTGDPEEAAVLPGMGITALAIDAKNNVYAAVMPGGKIFRIDFKGDKTEIASLPVTYVWDMKFDEKGNLFCVTGMGAGAFEIRPDNKVIPLYNSSETHFLSMFLDGKGSLYTGTSPGGLILKINIAEAEKQAGAGAVSPLKGGKPGWSHPPVGEKIADADEQNISLYEEEPGDGDSPDKEISEDAAFNDVADAPTDSRVKVLLDLEEDEAYRLLLLPDGNFLVAANRNQAAPPNPQNPRAVSRNQPLSFPIGQDMVQQNGAQPIPARMYLVTPEGRQRMALEVPDPYIMSLHSLGGDNVIVGTGNEGRIYTMNVKTDEAMLQSLPVKNVLAITGGGDSLRIATGNPGSVFTPAGKNEKKGQYLSSINDAGSTAFYGNMDAVASIPKGASLELQTRTGNTPDPMDGTWSEWAAPSAKWPFAVASPPGRYIQYMATLKQPEAGDNAPRLSEARVYYITENQGPEILKLKVLPIPKTIAPPSKGQGKPQGPQGPPQNGPPPINNAPQQSGPAETNMVVGTIKVADDISFHWEAQDPDSDVLRFTLEFRKLPSASWVQIEEFIYGEEYNWKTESLPDGTYEARLLVTDEDSNPRERALTDDSISDPFIIDHTRPTVTVEKVEKAKDGGFRISATASDPTSIISNVEYSLNDLEWRLVFPKDMIFDSRSEALEFTIDKTDSDENTILIRAKDFVGNTGSVSVPLTK